MEPTEPFAPAGLSRSDVTQRLREVGPNEIKEGIRRSTWMLVAQQFRSPLVIILISACVIAIVVGEVVEAFAIAAILAINASIGFLQEYRAENAIAALREMTSPRARVIREGRQTMIPAREVVPGDLLVLEAGDIVAADAIVLKTSRLQVNEAVLTGESIPVEKNARGFSIERGQQVFMGTSVATGKALAEVAATGMKTELGRIAHLIATAESEATPLQVQLHKVGRSLLLICVAVAGLVAAIGLLQGRSWIDLLIYSVSLAVAAVPEGMPAIITVALALGVQRLASRNALIRTLPSVETLGSVSVICTDKTGTLTTGKMRVREIWGDDHAEVLKASAACCDAELDETAMSGTGDPTEIAILIAAIELNIRKEQIESENPRIAFVPFDSDRRRMSILRKDGVNYVKGAPETILSLCSLPKDTLEQAKKAVLAMSERGLRVLAVAVGKGEAERDLTLRGLLGIADPPRTEAIDAISEARAAGIIPVMITGDHPETAAAIARELGLVLSGESLDTRVHARATPEDKLNLVRHWKRQGHIVAMTGDGANDAPALREAHVGIAMGQTGTEVTRQAADLVLADDNFATIVAAVREGRSIFHNIRCAITYLLTGNLAEIIVVVGSILFGFPLPLLAAQLLWINLVTDALPALSLIAEPISPNLMKRMPRGANEVLLGGPQWLQITWQGLLEASIALGLYAYLVTNSDEHYARGMIFNFLVFSQLLRAFGARSATRVFWEVGALSNFWLLAVTLVTACLQLSLHYIPFARSIFHLSPLKLSDVLLILPFALAPVTVIEIQKLGRRLRGKAATRQQR